MKPKKIWSADTAAKIAAAKQAKYGWTFKVVPIKGGGFEVVAIYPEFSFADAADRSAGV